MAEFVFSIIVALASIGAIMVIVFGRFPRNPKVITVITGGLGIILAGGLFFSSLFHSVPTKSVGVITSYGKVIGTPYGPGSHLLTPWRTLNIVQDTIQSDSFLQANGTASDTYSGSGATGYCITVRLGGSQEGCADIQLQTQTEESAIPELYANYSSYGGTLIQDIDQYVVKRELVTVLNRTLGDYNPVADVSITLNTGGTSQFSSFDPVLLSTMRADLAGEVDVLNINLQYVHYDTDTQGRINNIATQYADTQVAKEQEQTNAAISAANAALEKNSQSLTPSVLQYDCYQTIQDAIKAGYQGLPATLSCGGSSGSNVLISGK